MAIQNPYNPYTDSFNSSPLSDLYAQKLQMYETERMRELANMQERFLGGQRQPNPTPEPNKVLLLLGDDE